MITIVTSVRRQRPRSGRRLVVLLPVLLSALLVGCNPNSELPGEGTWRVINYWALWCSPCREEIPVLNALDAQAEITVLGVNFDSKEGAELEDHRRQLGIEFAPAPVNPSEIFGTPKPQVLPTTLLVNPQGVLVETLIGPQTEASILAAIASH